MKDYQKVEEHFASLDTEEVDCIIDRNESPEVVHCRFHSDFNTEKLRENFVSGDLYYHELSQQYIDENAEFLYPVLLPQGKRKYSSALIMLHGLNERSWQKYLPWAEYLVKKTKRPVILFPIAYHMNRSPKSWSDPRQMSEVSAARRSRHELKNSSFLNAAISTRLQYHPEQFIYSGLQSFSDLTKLIRLVQTGQHEFFSEGALPDLFAYSIGAFLAEILFLNNPNRLFDHSKLFLFCGGCTFDYMKGESKFIMDNKAFESLELLLQRRRLKLIRKNLVRLGIPEVDQAWDGLFMMMHGKNKRSKRERILTRYGNQIFAVGLEKDRVIVREGIIETLKGPHGKLPAHVEIIDFPFDYSHENPFPVLADKSQHLVDRAFHAVFDKAAKFFGEG